MQDVELVADGVTFAPKLRVCKAKGCFQTYPVVSRGGGGQPRAYCSPACRVRASRNGKAETAWEKVIEITEESNRVMEVMRELEQRLTNLAMEHSLLCDALEWAHKANFEERMEEYLP